MSTPTPAVADASLQVPPFATRPLARAVALQGVTNLRDLGGLPAAGGRQVRRGLLYRSDSLFGLTPEDRQAMAGLGLRTVCDFRGNLERDSAPSLVEAAVLRPLPIESAFEETMRQVLDAGTPELPATIGAERMRAYMRSVYERLPACAPQTFRPLFDLIRTEAHLPLLFHCTAGKDRTGFAAALILQTLGVHWDDIADDYLATNTHWRPNVSIPDGVLPDAAQVLFGAHADLLQRSFEVIDERHGSFDAYLARELGISDEARQDLVLRLTEENRAAG